MGEHLLERILQNILEHTLQKSKTHAPKVKTYAPKSHCDIIYQCKNIIRDNVTRLTEQTVLWREISTFSYSQMIMYFCLIFWDCVNDWMDSPAGLADREILPQQLFTSHRARVLQYVRTSSGCEKMMIRSWIPRPQKILLWWVRPRWWEVWSTKHGCSGSGTECGLVCGGGNAEDGLEHAEAMQKVNPSMQCRTISVKELDFLRSLTWWEARKLLGGNSD